MNATNPLIPNGKIKKINSFKTSRLISDYRKIQTDARRIFGKLKKIELFECRETGYQFFWPKSVVGDSKFYEELSKHDWYYSDWRWEHEISSKLLSKSDSVLEVGCGSGFFLDRIKTKVKSVVGLELNEEAIKQGVEKGLNIKNESIQDFADKNKNKYTIVCSYQVLEHVIDVGSFLEACIACLKPGGKLLISVPNNSPGSLIVNDSALNMPPHHMGRWSLASIANLAKLYNLKIENLLTESVEWDLQGIYRKNTHKEIEKRHPIFYKITKPILSYLINYFTTINAPYLHGHSIFAEFKKL